MDDIYKYIGKCNPTDLHLNKCAINLEFWKEYTFSIKFLKILKYHALPEEFLVTSAFSGQNFPKNLSKLGHFHIVLSRQ